MCQSTNPFPEGIPFDEIVFTERCTITGDGHWYANFGYYAGDPQKKTLSGWESTDQAPYQNRQKHTTAG